MKNLTIQTIITQCDLTPDQYELYEHPQRHEAANAINEAIMEHFNNRLMPDHDKWHNVFNVMRQYKHVGAIDSEPMGVVDHIFKEMKNGCR